MSRRGRGELVGQGPEAAAHQENVGDQQTKCSSPVALGKCSSYEVPSRASISGPLLEQLNAKAFLVQNHLGAEGRHRFP